MDEALRESVATKADIRIEIARLETKIDPEQPRKALSQQPRTHQ